LGTYIRASPTNACHLDRGSHCLFLLQVSSVLELGRLRFASNREACAGIQPYPLAVLDSDYRAFKDAHIHSDALTELATLVEPDASAHTEVRRPLLPCAF
jgi:hypothetical protein